MHLRELVAADLDWVDAITRSRREALAPHAPRFWHPAAGAAERHRAFLGHLIDDPATLALRTDHGYLVAIDRGTHRLVDDMVVPDDVWPTEGVALLRATLDAGRPVRFVVPASDAARREAALAVGLVPVEVWWHRDLPLVEVTGDGRGVQLSAPGGIGRLVPAPPVYDPGGPVLLVTRAESPEALTALEREAAARGATVSVVTQGPGSLQSAELLVDASYILTTIFYAPSPTLEP